MKDALFEELLGERDPSVRRIPLLLPYRDMLTGQNFVTGSASAPKDSDRLRGGPGRHLQTQKRDLFVTLLCDDTVIRVHCYPRLLDFGMRQLRSYNQSDTSSEKVRSNIIEPPTSNRTKGFPFS